MFTEKEIRSIVWTEEVFQKVKAKVEEANLSHYCLQVLEGRLFFVPEEGDPFEIVPGKGLCAIERKRYTPLASELDDAELDELIAPKLTEKQAKLYEPCLPFALPAKLRPYSDTFEEKFEKGQTKKVGIINGYGHFIAYRIIGKKTVELFESFPAETKLTVAVRDWLLEKECFVQVTITGNQECTTSCGVFVAQTVLDLLKKRKQRILPEEKLFQEANELIANRGKRFSPPETKN
jgi:hypothetical protein